MTARYVARLLELAFLLPALVEDILNGRQDVGLTAERLSWAERPLVWSNA